MPLRIYQNSKLLILLSGWYTVRNNLEKVDHFEIISVFL